MSRHRFGYIGAERPEEKEARVVTSFDMPKEHEVEEKPLRVPNFTADVLGVSVLVFAAVGSAFWAFSGGDELLGIGAGSAVAAAVIIWRTYVVFDRPVAHFRETWWQQALFMSEDERVELDRNLVVIPGQEGSQVRFWQPRPGAFAGWMTQVLADRRSDLPYRDKVTLSQNTARRNGWPRDAYRSMIFSLDLAGWIRRDGQYLDLTDAGASYIESWLTRELNNGRTSNGN